MKLRENQDYVINSVVICHCKEYPLDHGDCPVCMEEEE